MGRKQAKATDAISKSKSKLSSSKRSELKILADAILVKSREVVQDEYQNFVVSVNRNLLIG